MRILLTLFLILSTNMVYAFDDSALKANYPGFQDLLATSLVDLKSYFRNLYRMSHQSSSPSGHKHLVVQNKHAGEISTIDLLIERTISSSKITEAIRYVLPNGNTFDVTLIREGTNLVPSRDDDLLNFKFSPTPNLTRFEVNLVQLGTKYELKRTEDKEEGFLQLGTFELNVLIETFMKESEITRNYIFFTKSSPEPQSMVSVRALSPPGGWGEVYFLHYTPSAGEISPKTFFGGLGGISSVLKQMSKVFVMKLYGLGFPII